MDEGATIAAGSSSGCAEPARDPTIASTFAEFDADNSGFLTAEELQAALAKAGQSVSTEECSVVFQKMDKNQDGKVSLDEFAEALAAAQSVNEPKGGPPSMLARKCFAEFDTDNSGFIDLDEV